MKYNITKNKYNIDSCICNSKISKNELIMEFKIDDCIINDFDKNFNHHFLQAVKLYINRDNILFVKYINEVNKIVIEDSLLFMSDYYLNKIKNYFIYFMIKNERNKFENEFLSYRNTYHNIKIDKELFKKFYIYCQSYAYTYKDSDGKDYSIICPARIFNFKISNKLPILKHQIKDNIWRIFADKDYNTGEEIFECYYTMSLLIHPLLKFITLNDWKLRGYIYYCDMIDFNKNDEYDSKIIISRKLTVEDINNINKIYNIDYNELKQDLKKTSNHREYQILKLKIYEYKLINDAIKQNYIDYIKIEN